MADEDVNKVWAEFWEPIILAGEGGRFGITLTPGQFAQVKRELSDWHFAMGQVAEVYSHVTGGMLSKPNYHASGVISAADEHYENDMHADVAEAIVSFEASEIPAGATVAEVLELAFQHIADSLSIPAEELEAAGKNRERMLAMLAERGER